MVKSFASLLLVKGRRNGGPVIAKALGRTGMSINVDRADEV
jgi:hypothetical protein